MLSILEKYSRHPNRRPNKHERAGCPGSDILHRGQHCNGPNCLVTTGKTARKLARKNK